MATDEPKQQPTNINPLQSTSNDTQQQPVIEQPDTVSPATSPSIFCDIGIQPVIQEEATVSSAPIPTTSYATPNQPAIHEPLTVRSATAPSTSSDNQRQCETSTDNKTLLLLCPL